MWWYHDLPVSRAIRAWTSRNGWLVAIAAVYLYCFPYYPAIHSANELPRVYLTRAIVDEGALYVDTGAKRWGSTADISPSHGHEYSNKAPGASFLAVPAYAVARIFGDPSLAHTMWICRVFAGVVPTLIFLWFLVGWLERFTPDIWTRRLVAITYALGSMAMTYSVLFFSHQLAAVCMASAWMLAIDVADGKRRPIFMVLAGFLAGYAPLADYQALFGAVPIAIHVVYRVRKAPWKPVLLATAGALPPIILLLAYHKACFGSPWKTGYDASESFAHFHQHGFLGITALRREAFVGSFLAADNGLFALSPWLLIGAPGAVYLWRSHRDICVTCLGGVLVYALFISSINFWRGGWGVGPRYITELIPFGLPLVCAALVAWRDKPWHLAVAGGLILVAATQYLLSTATFPFWPEQFKNPVYDLVFPLLGDNLVAPNPFGNTIVAIVPYLIIGFGLVLYALYRLAGPRVVVASIVAAGVVLALYLLFPRGHDLARPYQFVREALIGAGM